MSLFPRWWGWLVPAAFVCGCGPEPPEHHSTLELLADTPVAEKQWEGILLEIGSPAARPFLEEGWSHGETDPEGNAYRWAVGERARFWFPSSWSGTRIAWIECEPFAYEGSPAQVLDISLNGRRLPPLRIGEGRGRRYPVELNLVRGINTIEIGFAYARAPADIDADSADRRRLAVAFYRFEVPPKDLPPVADKPGAFSLVQPVEAEAGVYIPDGGCLSYFLEIPEQANLFVRVGAENPEQLLVPAGARLEIEARPEEGEALEVTADASSPSGEVLTAELPLIALAGQRVELSFRAVRSDLLVRPYLSVRAPTEGERVEESELPEARNLLVIVLDGATAHRMGPYGFSRPTTPEIDRLASRSVVFDRAITQAVYTVASIGSVLTGQYPERHQSVSFAARLPASAVTFPALLSRSGVLTAGFSGNAVVSSAFGLDRGYDQFYPVRELENYTGHGDSVLHAFSDWIAHREDRRFFAYVHFREPHFPYNPPPPYDVRFGPSQPFPRGIVEWSIVEKLNRAAGRGEEIPAEVVRRIQGLYDGNMAYVDHLVGQMLMKLDERGLRGQTAILLTADHGEALSEHGYIGHNTQLYEESIRVPLMVHLPGLAPGRVSDVVELIDIAPTVLELMGLADHAAGADMQGRSLVPLLQGMSGGERLAFSRTLWNKPRYSVTDGRYKLIWDSRADTVELFDLKVDPGETVNLVGRERVVAGFLHQRLFQWLRQQEYLRAGAPAPESVVLGDDLRRQLDALGYVEFLGEKKKKK